jgi:sulfatase modifying factor 1
MMKQILSISLILVLFSCLVEKKSESQQEKKSQAESSLESETLAEKKSESKPTVVAPESEMIYFEGGTFLMGSENGLPNENPVHEVTVKPFYIDKSPVTVAQFRHFVEVTGFKTEAEKYGDSGVFNFEKQQWELLPNATWFKPFGPDGPIAEDNHPVTHVSWNDAMAYANWAGKRLPTEKEWEYAARSGKNSGEKFSWGNEISVNGNYFANTWQGTLDAPETKDGYLFTSPVGAFGENEAGVTDMGGNVWQWCANNYKPYPGNNEPVREDPKVKVIRSGSFFYDANGEDSFSVSGRSMNSHETSLFNTGFRCAKDG